MNDKHLVTSQSASPLRMMQIVGAVERTVGAEKKSFWKTIGVAFQNKKDGSWNLLFDYLPARMGETTIQLREFDAKEVAPAAE